MIWGYLYFRKPPYEVVFRSVWYMVEGLKKQFYKNLCWRSWFWYFVYLHEQMHTTIFNGNFKIRKWRYCTIDDHFLWRYLPSHRPEN